MSKNEVTAMVYQRPYEVKLTCPHCEHENIFTYDDFCGMADEPPDWMFTKIDCNKCGNIMEIDDQDWEN